MKLQIDEFYRILFILALTLLMTACGSSDDEEPPVVYNISADTNNISYVHYEGEELSNKHIVKINYDGSGVLVGFAPDANFANWLSLETKIIDDNTAELHIDLLNTQFIAHTDLETTLRISTGDVVNTNLASTDIKVSLKIWQLHPNLADIQFNSKFNAAEVEPISLEIVAENTNWTVSATESWLNTDLSSGEGDAAINVSVEPSKIAHWGKLEANLIFTEASTGDTRTFPVSYAVDAYRLFSSDNALAFVSADQSNYLNQTINIYSNSPTDVNWGASTNASWLTLTEDDNTDQLTIIADDSGLTNGYHTAEILLSATGENSPKSDIIHVSIYKQSATPTENAITLVNGTSSEILQDPLRPYLYFSKDNELLIYHMFTGEEVFKGASPVANGKITSLVVHPEGEMLVVNVAPEDKDEESTRDTLYNFSPESMLFTQIEELGEQSKLQYNPKSFIQIEGLTFVVSQAMEIANTSFERIFFDSETAFLYNQLIQPGNQASFFATNGQLSLYRFTANVNEFFELGIAIGQTHSLLFTPESDSLIFDFNVNTDESNLYLGSTDTEWLTFDGITFEDKASLHGSDEIKTFDTSRTDDGRVFFLRINSELDYLLDSYDDNQQLIVSQPLVPQGAFEATVSSHGVRVITLSNAENGEDLVLTLSNIN